MNKWGKEEAGRNENEFCDARGLTVDSQHIYVCDRDNCRVVVLLKKNSQFHTKWGKYGTDTGLFSSPYSIYHNLFENIFYVGDSYSLQLFTQEGTCLQRIGDKCNGNKMNQFSGVFGVCVIDDQLFVSDYNNRRIQIFRS